MREISLEYLDVVWLIFRQMAPYLLLGFLVAGVLSVCTSPEWIKRHLGGRGFRTVMKASLFGIPLPLCSCGVIPVAASIRQHGASRAATTSFLLSTPQTGVDSIAVTYSLLGPVFAVIRPLAALITGLVGGSLVRIFGGHNGAGITAEPSPPSCSETCCTDKNAKGVLRRILYYGFVTLPRDIGVALLIGMVITGAMSTFVPQDHLNMYIGGGVLSILLMMAAGIPLYVCATASVPIAVGLIHMGASPGAALAFLIAGPATNSAAFTTIWKVLGRGTAFLYLLTVAVSAIVFGLLIDWFDPAMESVLLKHGGILHSDAGDGWFSHVAAVVLLLVLVLSFWLSGFRKKTGGNKTGGTR